MTKKDYIKAAKLIQAAPIQTIPQLVETFSDFFVSDNPRFDKVRFAEACWLNHSLQSKPIKKTKG